MKTLPKGFKDSDIGPIPQDWEVKALGELGNWTAGVTPIRSNPNYYGGNIPWIKTGELTDGYIHDAAEYITELALSQLSLRLNPIGSILIAMYGATIGKLGILAKPMTTNQACCACIPLGNVNNTFIFYQLLANRGAIIKQAEGAAQPNISKEKILVFSIGVPPFHEQQAIAGALSDIDALIGAQEELLAKKRAIKQGAMQELLTGRRRLSGFPVRPMKQTDIGPIPEDWEVRQIGSAAISVTPPKKIETSDYRASGCYRVIDQGQEQCAGYSDDAKAVLQHPPYILFGDHTCIVKYTDFPFIQGADGLKILKANGGVFPRYLYYAFFNCTIPGQGYNRHWSIAKELQIPIPALPEQRAIAEVLCAMDMEIEKLEEGLAKHRALKHGMMQELLSGRIRLPYKKSTHRKQNAGE